MSGIRKQSIISSFWVYVGFFAGFINTYLFTRKGSFSVSEFGLTSVFISIGSIMASLSNVGMNTYIFKFYPYYNDNLPKKKNDMLAWALLFPSIAFLFVTIAGIVFKDIVVRKFSANSPELIKYYFWIFPFAYFMMIFTLLEAYTWSIRKPIVTTFLRETGFKLFTTALLLFAMFKWINHFDLFIKIYAFSQFILVVILLIYLYKQNQLHFTFKVSIVTKKFFKKIKTFCSYIYGGSVVYTIAQFFDTLVISSLLKDGLAQAGIFGLASNISGLVQAPQRGVVASTLASVSQAWKDKDIKKINLLYHRSAINLYIGSLGIFLLVWMNFTDAVITFNLREDYLNAMWVFFLLGLGKVIDMGTGINGQLIGTSVYWRFEFTSGILLLFLTMPLNYLLVKNYGIMGAGITNVVAFTIYNSLRIWFLWNKYKIHPFSVKMLYATILALLSYGICYFLFHNLHGLPGLFSRSISFCILYALGIWKLNLTPDLLPVVNTIKKRLGLVADNYS